MNFINSHDIGRSPVTYSRNNDDARTSAFSQESHTNGNMAETEQLISTRSHPGVSQVCSFYLLCDPPFYQRCLLSLDISKLYTPGLYTLTSCLLVSNSSQDATICLTPELYLTIPSPTTPEPSLLPLRWQEGSRRPHREASR